MNLTQRLRTIARHVPKNSICGDIGTDHGYIPIYLVRNRICKKVIATDINEDPIKIAREQIKAAGLEGQIQTRLGDGLKPLRPGEVDCVVIAGMGGLLIRDILKSSEKISRSIDTFILQPMMAQKDLRKYLIENKYTIVDEDLAQEDRRIYEIIIVKHGQQRIEDEIYLEIPFTLMQKRHPLLKALIETKKDKLKKIIKQCEGKKTVNAENKIEESKKKLLRLEEVEKCL